MSIQLTYRLPFISDFALSASLFRSLSLAFIRGILIYFDAGHPVVFLFRWALAVCLTPNLSRQIKATEHRLAKVIFRRMPFRVIFLSLS